MSREVTVTIIREMEIEVRVGLYDGCGPTLTDPGELDEAWIVEARDENEDKIELDPSEAEAAVTKAWNHKPDDDTGPDPDDDEHKPF